MYTVGDLVEINHDLDTYHVGQSGVWLETVRSGSFLMIVGHEKISVSVYNAEVHISDWIIVISHGQMSSISSEILHNHSALITSSQWER